MADWTTVPAKVIKHTGPGEYLLEFTDDSAPTPLKQTEKVRGASTLAQLESGAYRKAVELGGVDDIPAAGANVALTAPSGVEQAIGDANAARGKLRNLNAYQAESKKADGGIFGSSGVTVAQARDSLIVDAEADVTNQARLAVFLEETS